MQLWALDRNVIERAAAAVYKFDEDLTENDARQAGRSLTQLRLSWEELCEAQPIIAEGYRARAKAALLAAMGANQR